MDFGQQVVDHLVADRGYANLFRPCELGDGSRTDEGLAGPGRTLNGKHPSVQLVANALRGFEYLLARSSQWAGHALPSTGRAAQEELRRGCVVTGRLEAMVAH